MCWRGCRWPVVVRAIINPLSSRQDAEQHVVPEHAVDVVNDTLAALWTAAVTERIVIGMNNNERASHRRKRE